MADSADRALVWLQSANFDASNGHSYIGSVMESWGHLDQVSSLARLEGPEDISMVVYNVQHELGRTFSHASEWLLERTGETSGRSEPGADADMRTRLGAVRAALSDFERRAMDALRADGMETDAEQVMRRGLPHGPVTAQ